MDKVMFREKVENIARILGYSAEITPNRHYHATLTEGYKLLRLGGYVHNDEDRLNISGGYPRAKAGYHPYGYRYIQITVTMRKSPEQIARDIERRLLPKYLPRLESALEHIQQHDQLVARRTGRAKELADIAGSEFIPANQSDLGAVVWFGVPGNVWHKATVSGMDSVLFTLHSFTFEEAKKVVKFLSDLETGPR